MNDELKTWTCPVCNATYSALFVGPCQHPNMPKPGTVPIPGKWDPRCVMCGQIGSHGGMACPGGSWS